LGYAYGTVAEIPIETVHDGFLAARTENRDVDVRRQIDALLALKDGWLNGEGLAFEPDGLTRLLNFISRLLKKVPRLPCPRLHPSPEGSVLAEWSFPNAEVSVELDLNDGSMLLIGTHIKTQAHEEERSNWQQAEAATCVAYFVTKMNS